jgi:hypothetical protein
VIYVAAPNAKTDIFLMALTTFDTHELVKDLKAAGFTDDQAEAVTRAVKNARDIDLSDVATKADLKSEVGTLRADIALIAAKLDNIAANYATKAELSDMRTDIIRWVFGLVFAQAALIIALIKLLPGSHP